MNPSLAPRVFFPPKPSTTVQPQSQQPETPQRQSPPARRFAFTAAFDPPASTPGTPRGYEGDVEDVDDQDTETIFLERPRRQRTARQSQLSKAPFVLAAPKYLQTFGSRRDNPYEFPDSDVDVEYDSDAVYTCNNDLVPTNLDDVNEYYTPSEESDHDMGDPFRDDASFSDAQQRTDEDERDHGMVGLLETMGRDEQWTRASSEQLPTLAEPDIVVDPYPIVRPGPARRQRRSNNGRLIAIKLRLQFSPKGSPTTATTPHSVRIRNFNVGSAALPGSPFLSNLAQALIRNPEMRPPTVGACRAIGYRIINPKLFEENLRRGASYLMFGLGIQRNRKCNYAASVVIVSRNHSALLVDGASEYRDEDGFALPPSRKPGASRELLPPVITTFST